MKPQARNIELLTTNALGFPPIVFHRAIKFYSKDNKPYIVHRTTTGAEILDYKTFMKDRYIIHQEPFPIRFEFNPVEIVSKDTKPFDWMNNNCEDFASEVVEQTSGVPMKPRSPQRTTWMIILAMILITIILVKR